jgi:hypothetical protein
MTGDKRHPKLTNKAFHPESSLGYVSYELAFVFPVVDKKKRVSADDAFKAR